MANLQLSPDLSDALAHRNLVVFWGGDLPQALTGLPSRQDLAQRLAARTRAVTTPWKRSRRPSRPASTVLPMN